MRRAPEPAGRHAPRADRRPDRLGRGLARLGGLVAGAGLAIPAPAETSCVLGVAKVRYEDDIACFVEQANQRDWLDRLKFVPLGDSQARASFGGEIRQRYEFTHNPAFGADPQDSAGVWLQRYAVHADLRIGEDLRLFAQLVSALATGRAGGPGAVDENELELQNGFVDLGPWSSADATLTLRPGRQELQYGAGRLVDVREGPNVRRTFDAARAIVQASRWRVDALYARPRLSRRGVFDDVGDDAQALWGAYAAGRGVDYYYLGFRDDEGVFQQGTAHERRHSLGVRLWGGEGPWDWNWEALYQFGRFGGGDIRAWTLATDTGYTFRHARWRPRVAINANVASGDDDPDDPDLGTFNPLYPRGNYFSEAAVLGPRNFFNVHPFVTVRPAPGWSVTADVNFFWRLETADGVYSPSGQLIRAAGGSDRRFVAWSVSLTSEYAVTDRVTLTAIYTHLAPGDFIRATGPAENIDFLELTLQFRF